VAIRGGTIQQLLHRQDEEILHRIPIAIREPPLMVPMAIAIMEITVQTTLVIPVSIAARKGRTTVNSTGIVNAKEAAMNFTAGTADLMNGISEDIADDLPFSVGEIDISHGNYPYVNPANAGFFYLDLSAPHAAAAPSTLYASGVDF
jgi:hypothetical protein